MPYLDDVKMSEPQPLLMPSPPTRVPSRPSTVRLGATDAIVDHCNFCIVLIDLMARFMKPLGADDASGDVIAAFGSRPNGAGLLPDWESRRRSAPAWRLQWRRRKQWRV